MRKVFSLKRARVALPALLGAASLAFAASPAAHAQGGVSVTDPSHYPAPVAVAIGDVTVREPLSDPERPVAGPSQVPARFVVKLSRAYSGPVTVAYRTVDGTATAGSDYTAKQGTVTIPAGATSAPIDVMVRADRLVERDETFAVELTGVPNVIGIPIADGKGLGTILDNTF